MRLGFQEKINCRFQVPERQEEEVKNRGGGGLLRKEEPRDRKKVFRHNFPEAQLEGSRGGKRGLRERTKEGGQKNQQKKREVVNI